MIGCNGKLIDSVDIRCTFIGILIKLDMDIHRRVRGMREGCKHLMYTCACRIEENSKREETFL